MTDDTTIHLGRGSTSFTATMVTVGGHTFPVLPGGQPIDICGKCDGAGHLAYYANIFGGDCFSCGGAGAKATKAKTAEEFAKILDRRAKEAARRAAKREAENVARRAMVDELDRQRDAILAAHPLLIDITYLDNMAADGRRLPDALQARELPWVAEALSGGYAIKSLTDEMMAVAEAAVREQMTVTVVDVVEGRGVITGTVISLSYKDSQYGGAWKLLLQDDRGFRLWGTCPSTFLPENFFDADGQRQHIAGVEKGSKVTFTATVTLGGERGFGFYSRPVKPSRIEG